MKHIKNKKLFLYIFLFLSLYITVFSCIKIIGWANDNYRSKVLSDNLREKVVIDETDNISGKLVNPPEDNDDLYWSYVDEPFLQVDYEGLIEENSDTVGWIQVGGTTIDQSIVQAKNNEYYLTHSFDKSVNRAGWIFLDYRNNLNELGKNTIIYGHRMKDKSMFGTLKNVLEKEWYKDKSNYIIKLSTLKESSVWLIFSIYSIYKESYYITTDFHNVYSFQKYIDTVVSRSQYDFNTKVDVNDKILTLSTCKDSFGNRLVVHAKLIKKGTSS